jgi:hypothetical protein
MTRWNASATRIPLLWSALQNAKEDNGQVVVADGDYGPLQVMMANLLQITCAGALDGYLLSSGGFYHAAGAARPAVRPGARRLRRSCRASSGGGGGRKARPPPG